jgi:aminopeptidase N
VADRPIDIRHIRLDLNVDLPKKTVDGRATLQVRSLRPLASIALDAVDFEVKKVLIGTESKDGDSTRFSYDGTKLVIDLPSPWAENHAATLRIDYRLREPKTGLHFFGPSAAEPEVRQADRTPR